MVSVLHALSNPRQGKWKVCSNTYAGLSRDADLPLEKVHGAIGSFGWFSIEALDGSEWDGSHIMKIDAYKRVIFAPLLALFGEACSADA